MGILILIAVELISSVVIISSAATKSVDPKVLGQQIAQAEVPAKPAPADSPPVDASPPDQENPAPEQSPAPAAEPFQSPTPAVSPSDQPAPTDPFAQTAPDQYPQESPSPSTAEPPNSSPSPQEESASPQPQNIGGPSSSPGQLNPVDFSGTQVTALVDATQLLSSLEYIPEEVANKAKVEEEEISKASTGQDKTTLLLTYVQDKVNQINLTSDQNDFASANFAALRLTDQVQKLQDIISSLPPNQSLQLNKQLQNFCKRSDFSLKTNQLIVPEESEQDLEIARGQCLSTNL